MEYKIEVSTKKELAKVYYKKELIKELEPQYKDSKKEVRLANLFIQIEETIDKNDQKVLREKQLRGKAEEVKDHERINTSFHPPTATNSLIK